MGNTDIIKLLKTAEFQNRVKAIVDDEAHLVVDWHVNYIYSCNIPIKLID